jgi:hypothetical protein
LQLADRTTWWNGRLVTFLIRQGRFVEAREEWKRALMRVDPGGDIVQRSPVVAEELHRWVARAWSIVGCRADAESVLAAVPQAIVEQSDALRGAGLATHALSKDERNAPTWLDGVRTLMDMKRPEAALDQVFNTLDVWLEQSDFDACEHLLSEVNVSTWDTRILLAILTVSSRYRQDLPGRPEFFASVRNLLEQRAPERAQRLLDGLE